MTKMQLYTADGQRASLHIPSLFGSNCPYAVAYGYTGRQQVKTIGYNGALAASYTYDLAGNRLTRTLANNTVAKYTYDADNRVTVLGEDQGATPWLRNHYTYDVNSRITAVTHDQSGSGMTFGYDLANQVTSYVNQGPGPEWGPEAPADTKAFTYDNAANRTSLTDKGATSTWSPNGLNQYTSITLGSTVDNLSYDLNGNLPSYNGVTVTYNAENQVESISSDGFTMYLGYDPLGRCVWAGNSDDGSYYVYDGRSPIVQWDGGNGWVDNLFVYGVGMDEHLLTVPVNGIMDEASVEPYFFCQEPNANVIALTDSTGNFFESYQYDLFGNPFIYQENKTQLQQSQVGNLYMFQGRPYFSDFGVYNFRHRTYSPTLGRFLQGDPIGFSGGNNLYAFVGNNPVNGVDPLGLEEIAWGEGGSILLPPIEVDGYPSEGSPVWTPPFAHDLIDCRLDEAGSDLFPVAIAFPVIEHEFSRSHPCSRRLLRPNPFPDSAAHLTLETRCRAQVPLDPLEVLEHARAQLALIFAFADPLRQSLGSLIQYRQSHRQMKPVQQVHSLRIQIQLHVAYVLAAVGEEIDLLVGQFALDLARPSFLEAA